MKLLAQRIISWELYCSHAEWRAVVNAVPFRSYCTYRATDTPKGLTINVIMLGANVMKAPRDILGFHSGAAEGFGLWPLTSCQSIVTGVAKNCSSRRGAESEGTAIFRNVGDCLSIERT